MKYASLIALVFLTAACGSSDGDEDAGTDPVETTAAEVASNGSGDPNAEEAVQIEIVSEVEFTWIASNEFHFIYFTNDVCGSGNFVVREKESGEVINTFEGEEGCYGPRHGGFPAASNYFGEFDLKPETTYVVTETVRGTADGPPDGDALAPGKGTAVIEFEVTTTAVGEERRFENGVEVFDDPDDES